MRVESERSWDGIAVQVDGMRKYLLPVAAESNYSPVERVDQRPELVRLKQSCGETIAAAVSIEKNGEDATRLRSLADDCIGRYIDHYFAALSRIYHAADLQGAARAWSASEHEIDVEALLAFSHNTAVLADIDHRRRMVLQHKTESVARIEGLRQEELRRAAASRTREIQAAEEENRQVWLAVAAGLQAGAANMQAQQSRASAYSTGNQPGAFTPPPPAPFAASVATSAADGCTSDFACGIGQRCLKQNYSSRGVCVRNVNEYGVPTYDMPSLDSVGPKMPASTDCKLDTDCPLMFICETRSGACLKR